MRPLMLKPVYTAAYLAIALQAARRLLHKVSGAAPGHQQTPGNPIRNPYAFYVDCNRTKVVVARSEITDYDSAISICLDIDRLLGISLALPWRLYDLDESFHFLGDGNYDFPISDKTIQAAVRRIADNNPEAGISIY